MLLLVEDGQTPNLRRSTTFLVAGGEPNCPTSPSSAEPRTEWRADLNSYHLAGLFILPASRWALISLSISLFCNTKFWENLATDNKSSCFQAFP